MFCRMGIVVIILVCQTEGNIRYIIVIGFCLTVVRRIIELIRSCQVFSLSLH